MISEALVIAGLFTVSATAIWIAAAQVGGHEFGPDDEG